MTKVFPTRWCPRGRAPYGTRLWKPFARRNFLMNTTLHLKQTQYSSKKNKNKNKNKNKTKTQQKSKQNKTKQNKTNKQTNKQKEKKKNTVSKWTPNYRFLFRVILIRQKFDLKNKRRKKKNFPKGIFEWNLAHYRKAWKHKNSWNKNGKSLFRWDFRSKTFFSAPPMVSYTN